MSSRLELEPDYIIYFSWEEDGKTAASYQLVGVPVLKNPIWSPIFLSSSSHDLIVSLGDFELLERCYLVLFYYIYNL